MSIVRAAMLASIYFASTLASAQSISFSPAAPVVGEPVSVIATYSFGVQVAGQSHVIDLQDHQVFVHLYFHANGNTPGAPHSVTVPIGTLPSGVYTVSVQSDIPPSDPGIAGARLTVSATSVPVPATGWLTLATTALLIILFAALGPNNSFKRTAATFCDNIMRCAAAAA